MNIFAHSSCTCLLVYFGHVLKSGVDESKTSGYEQNDRVPSMECMRIFGQASQESKSCPHSLTWWAELQGHFCNFQFYLFWLKPRDLVAPVFWHHQQVSPGSPVIFFPQKKVGKSFSVWHSIWPHHETKLQAKRSTAPSGAWTERGKGRLDL